MFSQVVFVFANILLILAGAISLADESRYYVYLVKNIPVQSTNCHEQAQALAARFQELTGSSEVTGRCESMTENGLTVKIKYLAIQPIESLSTAAEIGFPGQGYEFSTRRRCEAEIPKETSFFKELTGNEPLIVFCRYKENYYGRQRWALVIEGFGHSPLKPQWSSSLFPGRPTTTQLDTIVNDVRTRLNHSGLNVRFPFLQDNENGLRLTVLYYGVYGEQITSFSVAEINSLADCEYEKQELNQLQQNDPSVTTLGYCIDNPYHRGADLVLVVDVTRWHQIKHAVENFTGYEDCKQRKTSLIAYYRDVLKDPIVGGFCTQYGPSWKLNLVVKRNVN
jgi:hypothetical protein